MGKNQGGRATSQISWWESVRDHPSRLKRQMKDSTEISQLLVLVLVGDFNLQDICWKYSREETVEKVLEVCS